MMENVIIIAILAVLIGSAVAYIIKEKKNGAKCIGCSACSGCSRGSSKTSEGCGCGCQSDINN